MKVVKTLSAEEMKLAFWQTPSNWTNFTIELAKQRDLVSMKILEKIYVSPALPLSMQELQRELRNITRNKMTVWNHIKKLEDLDLVRVVRGKPLFVFPKKDIDPKNVKKLVDTCYAYLVGKQI